MKVRITKNQFYALGGLKNPDLCRVQYGRGWRYYLILDNR